MTLGELLATAGVHATYPLPVFGQADPSTEIYVNGAPVKHAYMVRSVVDGRAAVNRLILEYDVIGRVEE